MKLGLPVIALALLAMTGGSSNKAVLGALIGVAALIVAVVVFGLLLWKREFARSIGSGLGRMVSAIRKVVRKPPVTDWGDRAVRFRHETIELVARRWAPLTATTVLSHLALFFVLLLSLRAAGVSSQEVSWAAALTVFAFGRLVTAFPLTPGGLGIAELTYIGGIILIGRSHESVPSAVFDAQVAAGVLIFRALTYGLQIPLGGVTYLIYRRKTDWRVASEEPARSAMSVDPEAPHSDSLTIEVEEPISATTDRVRPVVQRRVLDAIICAVGLVVFLTCALIVRNGRVSPLEQHVFHWINGLPGVLSTPMKFVQFLGVLAVGPIVAIAAAVLRRWRLALAAIVVTVGKLAVERAVWHYVLRARPGTTIPGTVVRGNTPTSGLSFVSGHVILVTGLAWALTPYLRERWRILPWAIVALVAFARIYLGAHAPLDVVGGVALGLVVGGAANLIVGVEKPADRDEPTVLAVQTTGGDLTAGRAEGSARPPDR
jgi:membrane-associated phospholipid phosphatase